MTVVIGGGAAGLIAAAFASTPERPAVLVERTSDGGRKILISGGGRCNVLPAALEPERFVTSSPPHLVRHMLRSWPLEHQTRFFEDDLGVPLAFDAGSRKYFPASNRARDVRDALVAHARRRGVEFRFNAQVTDLTPIANPAAGGARWRVATSGPGLHAMDARSVIIATGGLSVPATGSDGTGFTLARRLGHTVHPTYAALAPIVATPPVHAHLSGLSLFARLKATRGGRPRRTEGGFLFTHRGYSGPAVLDLGPVDAASIKVAWGRLDAPEWDARLQSGTGLVSSVLIAGELPERLVAQLLAEAGVPFDRKAHDLRRAERVALIERLTAYALPASGDEGFTKAEVTGGGVALDEVDRKTLESLKAPGVYFCGEVLDAWGPIGGHNFAWAWATGRAAGYSASL